MDNLVLCLIIAELAIKEKETKKKVRFANDVKVEKPTEASMMCMIDAKTFFSFMKNIWIGDLGTSFHLTKDDMRLYDITVINK